VDQIPWLNEVERRAWLSFLAVVLVGMPEMERTMRPHGIVHIEYGLLAALSDQPEGLKLSDLAGMMNMSASRLSHRLRKLLDREYLEIVGSGGDGRVSIARITDAGRDFIAELAPAHLNDVRRLIFDHLDDKQVAALADALGTVADKLGACSSRPLGPPIPPPV
jgi:DNA-binding MarR family transcriptional regulator